MGLKNVVTFACPCVLAGAVMSERLPRCEPTNSGKYPSGRYVRQQSFVWSVEPNDVGDL